jgi:hypothetical protein
LERIWKEIALTNFKALIRYSAEETEENDDKISTGIAGVPM